MRQKDKLTERFGSLLYWNEGLIPCAHLNLDMRGETLLSSMEFLYEEAGFRVLLDICGWDRSQMKSTPTFYPHHRFEIVYLLLNLEGHYRLCVHLTRQPEEELPSFSGLWKNASWYEREVWEFLGLPIEGVQRQALFLKPSFEGHPLLKDFIKPAPLKDSPHLEEKGGEKGEDWITFRPGDPGLGDCLGLSFRVEEDRVLETKCEVGLLHRGVEKRAEEKTYQQMIPYVERLNYHCASLNSMLWCMSVEQAAGLEIPQRAKAVRMILMEFSRISNHLFCLGHSLLEMGDFESYPKCFELRELVAKAMESYCGARQMGNINRIGGLSRDFSMAWVSETSKVLQYFSEQVEEISFSFERSRVWMERSWPQDFEKGPHFGGFEALDWGLTGPVLRAYGISYDLRKTNPFYFYGDVDFEIPLGIHGDLYDRLLVRLEEIRQSLRIITQVLGDLPYGEVCLKDNLWNPSLEKRRHGRRQERWQAYQPQLPGGQWYCGVESSNGELGFYLVSDGGSSPYRLKIRPPSLALCQAYPKMIEGAWYERALPFFHSLNIISSEMDR